MYDLSQVKVMNRRPGMSNQWKWPINNNEIWFEKVIQKIAPPKPINSGRRADVTGSFKFDENI